MEALSVTDHRVRNVEVSAPQIRLEQVDLHIVTRPQQAESAGDTDLVKR
jgi:hypothetical protein